VVELLVRVLRSRKVTTKVEVSNFGGSLKLEELMDWISAMEKYFKWDEMEYVKRVKFYCTNLKGNITIGCEQL